MAAKKRSTRRPVRQASPKKSGTELPIGAKRKPAKKTPARPAAASPPRPASAVPAKAVGARTAPRSPRAGLRPTAGPLILGDLGITDEELAAFLPTGAPEWVRGVLWCQFDRPGTLADIEAHFLAPPQAERYSVSRATEHRFQGDADTVGVQVPSLVLRPKGKYVAYVIYGMRGDRYVEDGRWQLESTFREMGTRWGSNRAIHERFKSLELSALGATNVVELTE
jgi:hypothetical protein